MKFFIFIFIFISNVFNFSYSKDDDEELLLEEKKLVEPFIFGKKDVSSNHPYSIYVTLKEVLLSEYTFHPYGLRDDPENASSQTYFLFNQLTSSEKSSIYGYTRRSIGKIINFDELLELFEKFKKPEMRFFILGNYNYPKDPLFYVKNDINLWHKISKEIFDLYDGSISIYENLTRKDFDKIFKDFIKKIQKDELVIFLYIGHAMKNGMPIFIDYESISQKDFYSYISEFQNDTLLLGDFSYIENSFKQEKNPKFYSEKKPYYRLDEGNSASFTVKENIFKFFSPLRRKDIKEGIFYYNAEYNNQFYNGYKLIENLKIKELGYGVFSLFCITAMADFIIYFSDSNLSINGFVNLIDNKISNFEERGIIIPANFRHPLLNPKFKIHKNSFLLYKELIEFSDIVKLKDKTDSLEENSLPHLLELNPKNDSYEVLDLKSPYLANFYQLSNFSKSDFLESFEKVYPDLKNAFSSITKNPKDLNRFLVYFQQIFQNTINNEKEDFQNYLVFENRFENSFKKVFNQQEENSVLNSFLANLKKDLGLKYARVDQYRGKKLLSEALISTESIPQNEYSLSDAIKYNNLGNKYLKEKKYNYSLLYYNKSILIKNKLVEKKALVNTYNNLGILFFLQNDYKKAIQYFEKCVTLEKNNLEGIIKDNLKLLILKLVEENLLDKYKKEYISYEVWNLKFNLSRSK